MRLILQQKQNRSNRTDIRFQHQQTKVSLPAVVGDAENSFLQTQPKSEVMRGERDRQRERIMPLMPSYSNSSPSNEFIKETALQIQKKYNLSSKRGCNHYRLINLFRMLCKYFQNFVINNNKL